MTFSPLVRVWLPQEPSLFCSFSRKSAAFRMEASRVSREGGGTVSYTHLHKVEGDAGNRAQVGVHCYSSRDLYNWKDEGIALKAVSYTHLDVYKRQRHR